MSVLLTSPIYIDSVLTPVGTTVSLGYQREQAIVAAGEGTWVSIPTTPTPPASPSLDAFFDPTRTGLVDPVTGLTHHLQKYNVKNYGAKGDGRIVIDAVTAGRTGAGTMTITSATAAFTSEDVGKVGGLNARIVNAPTYSFTVVSVQSATSITVQVSGTVSAIASNGSMCLGTDDYAAIAACNADAKAVGGTVYFPDGVYLANGLFDIGTSSWRGSGKAQSNPLGYPGVTGGTGDTVNGKGTILIKASTYSASQAFVKCSGRGSSIEGMSIDAARLADYGVWISETQVSINGCLVARGATRTLYATAGSCNISNCLIYGGMYTVNPVVMVAGDSQLYHNYIFGGGANQPTLYVNGPADDCIIQGNHFYRGGSWGTLASAVPGGHITVLQFSASIIGGAIITGNVFDTCEGDAITLQIANGSASMRAVTITGNQFYQPQSAITDNSWAWVKVLAGASGAAADVGIEALTVMGNTGKGNSTTKRWKSIIDYNLIATYGFVNADSIMGNTAIDCAAISTVSGAVHTPAYSAGNAVTNSGVVTVG